MPSGRILLVEDEILIRLILEETLEEAGFEVVSADSADAGATISETVDGFDLLVTDIQTPGGRDGIQLAREMRGRDPELPVLFTTGRPSAMSRYGRLGDREVLLPKPYGPAELLRAVSKLLDDPAIGT